MSPIARSLQLFFIDGRPDGMLTAEVFNWTGHVLRIPRTQLKNGLGRAEAQFTGVYVLIGDQNGTPLAYVGEAEDMASRLRDHAAKKEWWDTAILITTSANNLHKAHVRYLERRLVEIAKDVNAMALDNGNHPSGSSLSEADLANMESYLDTLMMVLPAIRVDNFLSKKRVVDRPTDRPETASDTTFECKRARDQIKAQSVFRDGEMIVLKGSLVSPDWLGQDHVSYRSLHEELRATGIIAEGAFSTDYAFSSPSAAAAVVLGRPANGRTEWKVVGTGQTYAAWEDAQLAQVAQ